MNDDDPRLTKLETDLKSARHEFDKDYNPEKLKNSDDGKALNDGARAGVELVGALFGGGLIGYGLDHLFNTTPIFFFICIILGVFTGFYNIYKITLGTGTSVGFKGLKNSSKNGKQKTNFNNKDESS